MFCALVAEVAYTAGILMELSDPTIKHGYDRMAEAEYKRGATGFIVPSLTDSVRIGTQAYCLGWMASIMCTGGGGKGAPCWADVGVGLPSSPEQRAQMQRRSGAAEPQAAAGRSCAFPADP
jgi:hypothetical protein